MQASSCLTWLVTLEDVSLDRAQTPDGHSESVRSQK